MNDVPAFRFPLLSPTELADCMSSIIGIKIQPTDLNHTSRLDDLTCLLLSKITGINIQTDNRMLYFRLLSLIFKSIGFSHPIKIPDISDERDMKKWMRMLSYFVEVTGRMKNVQSAATEYIGKASVCSEKLKYELKSVERLEEQVSILKTKNAAEREHIDRLAVACSEATKAFEDAKANLESTKQNIALILESEVAAISEVTALEMDVKNLTDRLANLESRVIKDPEQLPGMIEDLETRAYDCEVKINSVYAQLGEVKLFIKNHTVLTTVIDRDIVATADDCLSCLEKISSLQSEIAELKLQNDLSEIEVQVLLKQISDLMEELDLIVSAVFRRKVILENQKKLDERVTSEKSAKWENLSSRIVELSEKNRINEIYLNDLRKLYEKEAPASEREEYLNIWARIEATLKHILQQYAEAYE